MNDQMEPSEASQLALFSYGSAAQQISRVIHMVELLEVPADRVSDLNTILDVLEEIEGALNAKDTAPSADAATGTPPADLGEERV